jgi:hypothetical protein
MHFSIMSILNCEVSCKILQCNVEVYQRSLLSKKATWHDFESNIFLVGIHLSENTSFAKSYIYLCASLSYKMRDFNPHYLTKSEVLL